MQRLVNFPSDLRLDFRTIFTTASLPPSTPTFRSSWPRGPTPWDTPASWAGSSWRASPRTPPQWLRPRTPVTRQTSKLETLATLTQTVLSTSQSVTSLPNNEFSYQNIQNSLLNFSTSAQLHSIWRMILIWSLRISKTTRISWNILHFKIIKLTLSKLLAWARTERSLYLNLSISVNIFTTTC